MVWFVHADLAAGGEAEPGDPAPALLRDSRGELDAFGAQLRDRRVDVVAHERQFENVREESPIRVGVAAEQDHVAAVDHVVSLDTS